MGPTNAMPAITVDDESDIDAPQLSLILTSLTGENVVEEEEKEEEDDDDSDGKVTEGGGDVDVISL